MEIKATLNKPYTKEERRDFIIEQNRENNYEIRETETELQAWGLTEEEKQKLKREEIDNLKCTKRVFVLMLQNFGISYKELNSLISSDEQAKLEWDLCIELQRNNPLLDKFGEKLGITPEQIDNFFKKANENK